MVSSMGLLLPLVLCSVRSCIFHCAYLSPDRSQGRDFGWSGETCRPAVGGLGLSGEFLFKPSPKGNFGKVYIRLIGISRLPEQILLKRCL